MIAMISAISSAYRLDVYSQEVGSCNSSVPTASGTVPNTAVIMAEVMPMTAPSAVSSRLAGSIGR